jgi:hypothetical protein
MIVALLPRLAAAQNAPAPAASPARSIGMFAYPKNKQSADQQLKDENECYASAKQNSGVDPQAPPPAAPSAEEQQAAQKQAAQQAGNQAPKGGAVKGSAKVQPEARPSEPSREMPEPAPPLGPLPAPWPGGVRKRKLRRRPQNRQLSRPPRLSNKLKLRRRLSNRAN